MPQKNVIVNAPFQAQDVAPPGIGTTYNMNISSIGGSVNSKATGLTITHSNTIFITDHGATYSPFSASCSAVLTNGLRIVKEETKLTKIAGSGPSSLWVKTGAGISNVNVEQ